MLYSNVQYAQESRLADLLVLAIDDDYRPDPVLVRTELVAELTRPVCEIIDTSDLATFIDLTLGEYLRQARPEPAVLGRLAAFWTQAAADSATPERDLVAQAILKVIVGVARARCGVRSKWWSDRELYSLLRSLYRDKGTDNGLRPMLNSLLEAYPWPTIEGIDSGTL